MHTLNKSKTWYLGYYCCRQRQWSWWWSWCEEAAAAKNDGEEAAAPKATGQLGCGACSRWSCSIGSCGGQGTCWSQTQKRTVDAVAGSPQCCDKTSQPGTPQQKQVFTPPAAVAKAPPMEPPSSVVPDATGTEISPGMVLDPNEAELAQRFDLSDKDMITKKTSFYEKHFE